MSALTESYDGTSWTEVGDLSSGRQSTTHGYEATANAQASFLVSCGNIPSKSSAVEEWTDPVYTIKTVTVS